MTTLIDIDVSLASAKSLLATIDDVLVMMRPDLREYWIRTVIWTSIASPIPITSRRLLMWIDGGDVGARLTPQLAIRRLLAANGYTYVSKLKPNRISYDAVIDPFPFVMSSTVTAAQKTWINDKFALRYPNRL